MPDIDDFSDMPTPRGSGSSDAAAIAEPSKSVDVATAPVIAAPDPTPSDSYWDQQAGGQKAMLREVLRIQSAQSPDAAAKASALSKQTGIPEDVAARNPQEAQSAAVAQHAHDLATNHPELAQWITAPRNAAMAHDDLPVLKTLDHTIQAIQAGRNGDLTGTLPHGMIYTRDGKILEPMPGGLANEYDSLQDVAKEMRLRGEHAEADEVDRQESMQRYGNPLYLGRFGRLLEQGLQAAQQSRGVANPEVDSSMHALNEAYPDESSSIPTGLARLAGGLAGQGPELLMGGELAPIAAALYDVSKAKSLISATMGVRIADWSGRGAQTAAVMAPMNAVHALEVGKENDSIGAGLTDFIASSGIVAATGPVGAAKLLIPAEKAAVARGTMPVFQHILKDAGLMGTQNAAMVISQALENRVFGGKTIDPDQLFHDIIANGELGAVAGGLFALGPAIADRYHREATAAAGSLESADQMKMALQQVRDSKLNKRSPEDMQAAMDASLSGTDADRHVYLQSEDWQQHWNTQGVDPVAKARQAGAEAAFIEAQATGGTMAVKLSSYLQTLSDSKTGEDLIAKTRMAPGAMTPAEAAKWHQTAPDQIEQLYKQGAADAAGRDAEAAQHPATEEIYQSVKDQISAARPHWPEATLDAVSRVYARTLSGIARFSTPEGAEPIDPRTLHEAISIGSELPESLRSKGFDAIKSLMERIHSGEGAATPEEEAAMADLSQHAEAIGGAVDQHTLDNIQGMMRDEASKTLEQAVHPKGQSLAFDDMVKQWKKANGDRTPSRGSEEWQKLVEEASMIDAANGKTYEQPAYHGTGNASPYANLRYDKTNAPGGEGTQREGYGVYVTESKEAGKFYRNQNSAESMENGRLYHLDIPDDTGANYLRLDHKLDEMPDAALDKLRESASPEIAEGLSKAIDRFKNPTGLEVYNEIVGKFKYAIEGYPTTVREAKRLTSDALRESGFIGNKYRGEDGAGNYSNYVLFQDVPVRTYEQPSRGGYSPLGDGRSKISLGPNADPSTVVHELGHYALDTLAEFASKDTASATLKRDMQTLYDHIGIKDQADWNAKDFDQRRDAHEKFAESYESYFMEGKAPSPELRGVFRKIRNLMVAIYRTLKPMITLTPEVRNVFDRLLEADTKMADAREEMGAKPLFRTAEEAGMGTDEFAAYLRDITTETEQDRARLMDRTMRDVARRLTDNWKAEESSVREDQKRIVNDRTEFTAMLALQSGKWPEGLQPESFDGPMKLDRADLVKRYGEDGLKDLPGRAGFSNSPNRGSPVYAKEGGIDLESAANLLGFRSGDELWQALTQSGNRTMEIDRLTRAEMDRRHPDPVEDGSLEQDAIDVLHGASQAKRIMRELDSLARPVGQAPPPIEVLRQVAERKIAERDVRAINPEVYRRAEAKATREVMEALAKQDRIGAYQAQVRRVLSSEMYRAAADAKQAVADGIDFAKKFSDRRVREILGKAGGWEWTVFDQSGKPLLTPDGKPAKFGTEEEAKKFSVQNDRAPYLRTSSYLGQIDSLRERFGFVNGNPSRTPESLDSFIREMADHGAEVVVPEWIATTSDRMPWKDLNYSQFRDVIDTLSNIEHLGRTANKLSEALGKGLLEQRLAELTAVSTANKQRVRNRPTTPGAIDRTLDMVANWDAMLTRLSTQIHIMDGFKEGGEWWETFVRPLQECATKEAKMQAADAEELKALADAAGYNDQSGWVYRREYIPEINDHQSHMGKLMIAAYYGRQEGRERLLTAHWTDDQIHRLVLDKLTAKDRDFLHGVWRMFDKKFPDLRAQEQRLAGVTVEQSLALPFRNSAGVEFKGGYIPIKYDPRSNTRAESLIEATNAMEQKRGAFGRAKTRDSMVKQTAQTTGMKLRLDEGVIFQGLSESNHRLAHQDVLTDLAKIISNKDMAETIRKNHGIDAFNLIRDTLTDVAGGNKENLGALGKVMHHLRTGVPAAAFGFNAMRAFLDIAESLPQAVARVSPVHLASAVGKMLGNAVTFQSFAKSIAAKSSVMADRQRTDLRMASDSFKGARIAGKARAGFDHLAQSVMHYAHLFTDHLVWQGAYEQSLAQGHPEAKAIALADSITQDSQSSARTMDLSKFQRGSEFYKMMTVAYGFFGSVYQMQKTIGLRGVRDIRAGNVVGGSARMFTNYLCLYSLPIAIDLALKSYLRGGPNDKHKDAGEIGWELAKEHLAFGLGTMPVFREVGGAFTGHMGYSGPAGERGVVALYGVAQGLIHDMDRIVESKPSAPDHPGTSQTERNALMAAGIIFHLPAVQVQRTIDGIAYSMETGANPIIPALAGKPRKQ